MFFRAKKWVDRKESFLQIKFFLDIILKYIYYRAACSISLGDKMVLTGGSKFIFDGVKTVSRYDKDGWVEDMPSLNQGRNSHGCTAFIVSGGKQVRLTI